jgi:hypothetical protein
MDIKYYDVDGIEDIFRDIHHFYQIAFCASVNDGKSFLNLC